MRRITVLLALAMLGFSSLGIAQSGSPGERDAIRQTALNYMEGYYDCNADRMESAIHPDLAKRLVTRDPQDGTDYLYEMSALKLVEVSRGDCNGKKIPREKQMKEITVLDVYQDMASLRVEFTGWVDYLHMTKFDGKWVIINVLWHLKPKPAQK